jgi:NADH-quinone oxidoreductase subunit E
MKLSDKAIKEIQELMKRYPQARSALIPALHIAQNEAGYLPRDIQEEVAKLFSIEVSEVESLVSFYDMFSSEPRGKKQIFVCKNISCMLRGGDLICDKVARKIENRAEYTLHLSECLGACDKAPVMIFEEKAIGPLTEEQVDKLFSEEPHG